MKGFEHLIRRPRPPRVPQVRISWRLYFRAFCEQHGPPLTHGGRLLFPDGWTYSGTSWKGPEWMPPEDPEQLAILIRRYWKLRRVAVLEALIPARAALKACEEAVATHSVPLQQITTYFDHESGHVRKVEGEVDPQAYVERVKALEFELAQALEEIHKQECLLRLLRVGPVEAVSVS